MTEPDPSLLVEVLRSSPDGVAVAAGSPLRLVYVNATLAALTRLPEATLVGRALEEIEIEMPVDANATSATVVTRVQIKRGDGSVVPCERWTMLMPDGFVALHYRPLQRAVTGAPAAFVDRGGGIASAEHLLETLRRDWSIGQRDGRALTLLHFDVDGCRDYLEIFGRAATENVLRQVGRTIASAMRRTSDVVARQEGDGFLALGLAMEQHSACEYAEMILGRIRALSIHHPRSRTGRFLTMSAGVVTSVPPRDRGCEALLEAARRALDEAKRAGGNCVAGGEL